MPLPRITAKTVVKLIIASLCVGLLLAYFNADPLDVLHWAREKLADLLGDAVAWLQWAVKYALIGAIIVVPIWFVHYLWRAASGRL